MLLGYKHFEGRIQHGSISQECCASEAILQRTLGGRGMSTPTKGPLQAEWSLRALILFSKFRALFHSTNALLWCRLLHEVYLFKCMSVCLHEHMCTAFMPGTGRGQKRALHPLVLELQVIVSLHVGARNQTWVLQMSNRCS